MVIKQGLQKRNKFNSLSSIGRTKGFKTLGSGSNPLGKTLYRVK